MYILRARKVGALDHRLILTKIIFYKNNYRDISKKILLKQRLEQIFYENK